MAYERGEENWCVVNALSDEDIRNRRQKISRTKPPKKATHKHIYEPCVFEFNSPRFTKDHGVVYDKPGACIGAYCPVCGKVGDLPERERWYASRYISHPTFGSCIEPYETDECKNELNPATRTLPTFWVEDRWFTKYVDLIKG